jgi:hypothetical protein
MTLSSNVVVTAVVLLVVSGGLLYPVHTSISDLEATIAELEGTKSAESDVPRQLSAMQDQIEELHLSSSDREFSLCPDTSEARNEFETALQNEIHGAGLGRISMDRQAGFGIGDVPSFTISLVVEGDAFQLHNFLMGLESLEWLTRVMNLEVQPGDVERRIKMKISVLLENNS